MSWIKAKSHSMLETMVYTAAKTGKGREATLIIPNYELTKEVGFGEVAPNYSLKITIRAEFIDEDGEIYDDREPATDN